MTGTGFSKRVLGNVVARLDSQCRYRDCIFVIGHMRCGSTALANVLCSRPEVSGYGEAHIAYRDQSALGVLALNQWRRGAWRRGARHLFDKILHSRYDIGVASAFFEARAIFVFRPPVESIRSIRALFDSIGSGEYATDADAAAYYTARMSDMLALWARFAPARRIGVSYDSLTADPDGELARLTPFLGFDPPLTNWYASNRASQARGAGDPTASHRFTRIVAKRGGSIQGGPARPLAIAPARFAAAEKAFHAFQSAVSTNA